MRKALYEAFLVEKREDTSANRPTPENDDYDLKHYKDENLDYVLLERLTKEMLEENGGDQDRGLTDTEYEEISERYFKRLEEERSTENANAWKTSPNTEHGSTKFGTTWATPTGENTRSEDESKTPTDDGRTISQQGGNTTPRQDAITTPVTRGVWWTTPNYWWTSPTYWDGTLWGLKTAWQTWKHTTARGTDSDKTRDHTKHFDWTGESKSGHQVHVVVYFEK